jgi:gamma-glutamylaminecyclotransferase
MRYTRSVILFVYGSLLRGEASHAMLEGARFVAEARTAPRYTLVDLGPYPALLDGGGTAVLGELYEVGEALLGALDELEGHPDFYGRTAIEIEGGGIADAYVMTAERAGDRPRVASGNWRAR